LLTNKLEKYLINKNNISFMPKLKMLAEALSADLAQQLSIKAVHNTAQDITCIEVEQSDFASRHLDEEVIPDSLFLVFDVPSLRLLLESDSKILLLWLDVLSLGEIYVSCPEIELGSLKAISDTLYELGLRAGRLVLGEPAVGRDNLVMHFTYINILS